MIAHADLTEDKITVHCPPRMKDLIKEIPGSRFKPGSGDLWTLPRTLNAAVQLIGQFGFSHVELSDALREQVLDWKQAEARAQTAREFALDPQMWADTDGGLLGYQARGLAYLQEVDSSVLGDDPGTGKTPTACAWLKPGPTLIVCPKAVQENWRKELLKFRPDLPEGIVLDGSAVKRRKILAAHALEPDRPLIVSYDQLPIHGRLAPYGAIKLTEEQKTDKELNKITWANVIADEGHRMFNPKTRWTRAFWWLGQHSERRLIMTGTPSESSPLDFLALLHAASPHEWPSFSKIRSYYMVSSPGFWGGVEVTGLRHDRREEWDRLVSNRFLRRPKDLVLPFLPPKVPKDWYVTLSPKMRAQYREMQEEQLADLDGGNGPEVLRNSGVLYTRLVQAASATLEIVGYEPREYRNEDGSVEMRDTAIIRMAEPSPKVDGVLEILGDLGDAPVMVSARSRQLLDLLSKRLTKNNIPHASILGGMRPDEIEHAKEQFNDGHVNVLLLSVSSAAEGLSLTRGSTIIRMDRSPKRRDNIQATDRMHGVGRGDHDAPHLLVYDIIAVDTVEQQQRDTLDDKDAGAEELFRDMDTIRKALKK